MEAEERIEDLQEAEESSNPNETKSEKFLRIAPGRVDKVISALNSLQKLSAHGSYEYSEEQIAKMFGAIHSVLDECEASFKPKEKTISSGFSF